MLTITYTAKQYAVVSIQLNIVICPTCPEKWCYLHRFYNFLLSSYLSRDTKTFPVCVRVSSQVWGYVHVKICWQNLKLFDWSLKSARLAVSETTILRQTVRPTKWNWNETVSKQFWNRFIPRCAADSFAVVTSFCRENPGGKTPVAAPDPLSLESKRETFEQFVNCRSSLSRWRLDNLVLNVCQLNGGYQFRFPLLYWWWSRNYCDHFF